jgi:hypothetical protein
MKKVLLSFAIVLMFASMGSAAPMIAFDDVTAQGSFREWSPGGSVLHNSWGRVTDGYFPPQWTYWLQDTTHFGREASQGYLTFDLGGLFSVEDVTLSLDNNDTYYVDYSLDNLAWARLFMVHSSYGPNINGTDIFSTVAGHSQYDNRINFGAVDAQYLRIWADYGQGDGAYSIGEFQAFGTALAQEDPDPEAVPEPSTMLLLGAGLAGLALMRRKTRQ